MKPSYSAAVSSSEYMDISDLSQRDSDSSIVMSSLERIVGTLKMMNGKTKTSLEARQL